MTLGDLAKRFSLELKGDATVEIRGICTLSPGLSGALSFLANPRYRGQLAQTQSSAVILSARDAQNFSGNALIAKDPYLAFARIAALFDSSRQFTAGVHPSAVIAADVKIPATCHVGALSVIEAGAVIGEQVFIGSGCTVGRAARIGGQSRLEARALIGDRVTIGQRARIQSGAVIGARGFGLARGPQGWEEVPQLGSVILGDDVEVGANTTIDRGAIGDTVLGNGVKLDNQIQIAHNVVIGDHTAIAACSGIAGSTRIGARCMIGGCVCINGHIEIADDVVILGFSMVLKSVTERGQYGGIPARPAREWRRDIARVHRLGGLEQRLDEIEQKLGVKRSAVGDGSDDDHE